MLFRSFAGFPNVFTSAIRDLAGNDLKSNNNAGTTTFSILLGNGLDFGDAPNTYGTSGANAASHRIVQGFFLGAGVSAEPTGVSSVNADSDTFDDGVVFNSPIAQGATVSITVTASQPGLLDAFIDFNGDGDFADAGEQIFVTRPLTAGDNTLPFNVPTTATLGTNYARFRLSSTGGLGPDGLANDGEVEDYKLTVGGPPWQNTLNPLDVSGDGSVSPLDALLIINFLNTNSGGQSIRLPNPPPFIINGITYNPGDPRVPGQDLLIDVNGDGFVAPDDVLQVINFLNGASAEGSGEGEGAAEPVTAAGRAMTSSSAAANTTISAASLASHFDSPTFASAGASTNAAAQTPTTRSGSQSVEFAFTLPARPSQSAAGSLLASSATNLASSDHRRDALDSILDEIAGAGPAGDGSADPRDAIFATFGA